MTPAPPSTHTTRHVPGTLSVVNRVVGPCRLTLERDPFAPNDMRAEVRDLSFDLDLEAD